VGLTPPPRGESNLTFCFLGETLSHFFCVRWQLINHCERIRCMRTPHRKIKLMAYTHIILSAMFESVTSTHFFHQEKLRTRTHVLVSNPTVISYRILMMFLYTKLSCTLKKLRLTQSMKVNCKRSFLPFYFLYKVIVYNLKSSLSISVS